MQILHRIATTSSNPVWSAIESAGIAIEKRSFIWVALVPDEHPCWPDISARLGEYDSTIVNKFSGQDVAGAEWLCIFAKGHHGYPQPEEGWWERTYEATTRCRKCGFVTEQRAPFRLRGEPAASHSQFLQLNWVFDEFFVRPAVRDALLAAELTGIEFVPPVIHRSGLPSLTVDQMRITSALRPAIDTSALQTVTCKMNNEESASAFAPGPILESSSDFCGRTKYHLRHRGPLQLERAAFEGAPDVVRTAERFGSGGLAFRATIVSQRFRELVAAAKWRGLSFEPVALV